MLSLAEGKIVDTVKPDVVGWNVSGIVISQPEPLVEAEVRFAQELDIFRHLRMAVVPAREVPGNTRLRVGRKDDRAIDVNLRLPHVVIGLRRGAHGEGAGAVERTQWIGITQVERRVGSRGL